MRHANVYTSSRNESRLLGLASTNDVLCSRLRVPDGSSLGTGENATVSERNRRCARTVSAAERATRERREVVWRGWSFLSFSYFLQCYIFYSTRATDGDEENVAKSETPLARAEMRDGQITTSIFCVFCLARTLRTRA